MLLNSTPVADPAPLSVFRISRAARSQGIKVLLSGAGADDLFTGYRRHMALQAEILWGGCHVLCDGFCAREVTALAITLPYYAGYLELLSSLIPILMSA